MKHIKYILILGCILLGACSKFLDQTPQGVISGDDLNSPDNVEKMVTAAYAALGNDHYTAPYSSMWPYGNIRSGDAYKGGDGAGDISDFHFYETFSLNRIDNGSTDLLWFRLYVCIGRVNDALARLNAIGEDVLPTKVTRQAEMRFLRGHYYFLLKILFKYVPYIDETMPKESYDTISNNTYTNDALWTKIADDFRFAAGNLPETQAEIGRVNRSAAKAYLAKTLLYQAYKQNESNAVTSIDATLLQQVNSLCDEVIASGKYQLAADYSANFLPSGDNGKESVFAIQYSKGDGTPKGRLDYGHALDYPMNQDYGCCGFHSPSNNLVNAFKTDVNGLPLFTTFNDTNVSSEADFHTNSFDPRLDHTVAIPGHPYKYDPAFIYQRSWARAPEVYGSYLSLKEAVLPGDATFQKIPPFMSSSKNWAVIRYADVLLFKAEALIELGRQNEALPLINQLRTRAAASTGLLKQAGGAFTSNYKMGTYQPGINCTWTQDFARQAMRWERRLEFAMEGYRFFDLVRWGIAAEYLNAYFTVEKTRSAHLQDAKFQKGRDEYLPVPLNQINFSKGLYHQNTGW
ncbi:RagB/SusD family nutrient uptake outer membrane protein [Chitinophaga agrisoli]|uniref:RagB/SusD family nutrient uptake outer membrane protein n=1 Tax=Chitinophaga agrisoli TaxID=2607653 RepID=A0A5B2VNL6_9BACT|nr:RagB/SusD family nutrient uptake outer membrane protein [Chitinophaga agrisoli]KAA2240374.1 RagB/SusD family nutrient uptake outer membrane protein [Chitinophaga agrisoli]